MTIGDVLLRLKGIIFIPFIVKYVGMADYGAYVQITVNDQMVTPLATLALGLAFMRYTAGFEDDQVEAISRDYWSVLFVSAISCFFGAAVIYWTAPVISQHILAGTSIESLRLAAVLVFTGCLYYQNDKFLSCRKHMKLCVVYQMLYGFLPGVGLIYGMSIKSSLFDGMLFYILAEIMIVLAMTLGIVLHLKLIAPDGPTIKKFFSYSWSLIFSQISGGLLSKVDRYFIGYYLGPVQIGIYNIVYTACSLLQAFVVPFIKYFGVYMSKVWDRGEYRRVLCQLREGLLYYLIISLGGLAGLTALLKPTLNILLNKRLESIQNFEQLIFVTGLGIVFFGASMFFSQLIKYKEKNHLQLLIQLLSVTINIVLNFFWVKTYGILGAGVATFLSYLAVMVLCNLWIKMDLGVDFLLRVMATAAGAVLCAFYMFYWQPKSILMLLWISVSGYAIYFLSLIALRVVKIDEIKGRFL